MNESLREQIALIMRGTAYTDEQLRQNMVSELEERIRQKGKLQVYLGIDPTTSELHLGHTVPIQKLGHFQQFGHDVILLMGTFTGLVGDPSERQRGRAAVKKDVLINNADQYLERAFKILDRKKTTVVFNYDWLSKLTAEDLLKLASEIPVSLLVNKEDFRNRLASESSLRLHEFMYCLLQGYDAIHLKADVQVGGTDQLFNIMVGRDLQKSAGIDPQIPITIPLLAGTDGRLKMSKTYGNSISVDAAPDDMYGKIMSIPDTLIFNYFELLTNIPIEDLKELNDNFTSGNIHPRDLKMRLAREIVGRFHGIEEAEEAENHFIRIFQEQQVPEKIEEVLIPEAYLDEEVDIATFLQTVKIVSSKNEGRRLLQQGGIYINQEKIHSDGFTNFVPRNADVIRVGKLKFIRLRQQNKL